MRLCVIDDHPINLSVLKGVIAAVPGWEVEGFTDPLLALDRCRAVAFDLVVVDYQMPGLDGIAFVRRLRALPSHARVPVVMVTADRLREVRLEAIRAGTNDFLTKPVDPEELRVRAQNLLDLRRAQLALEDRAVLLADEVAAATRLLIDREEEMILRLALILDGGGERHLRAVGGAARLIAQAMGLPPGFCDDLALAALLHDAGRGAGEGALARARAADARLGGARTELVRMAHEVASALPERWDGTGGPRGLAGEEIPLPARIVALAVALDAGGPPDAARREALSREAGRSFDPEAVEAMGRAWDAIETLRRALPPDRERAA